MPITGESDAIKINRLNIQLKLSYAVKYAERFAKLPSFAENKTSFEEINATAPRRIIMFDCMHAYYKYLSLNCRSHVWTTESNEILDELKKYDENADLMGFAKMLAKNYDKLGFFTEDSYKYADLLVQSIRHVLNK